jgi:hypothetical protein
VLVGGGHEGENVTTLATGKGIRAEVAAAVADAVDGRT